MEKIAEIEVEEITPLECIPEAPEAVEAPEVIEPVEPVEASEAIEPIEKEPEEEVIEEIAEACPHCGLNPKASRVEISETDRKHWMRYILSGGTKRFTKEYKTYGGRVVFKMKSRNGLEDRDIDLATNDFMHSVSNISDFNKIRIEMMKIQLMYSLEYIFYIDLDNPEQIRRVPVQAPSKYEIEKAWASKGSAAIEKYTSFLEGTPTPIMTLMCDKLTEFNTVMSTLTVEGLNPDF